MKLSHRQMALAGLCVVGLVVFIYDRMQPQASGAAPSTAAASETPAAGTAQGGAASLLAADTPANAFKKILADRLLAVAQKDPQVNQVARDAFLPSAVWVPRNAAARPAVPLDSAAQKADAFARQHTLQAMLISDTASKAVINGKTLMVGQEIDGFRLVSVEGRQVVLVSSGDESVTVRLTHAAPAPLK